MIGESVISYSSLVANAAALKLKGKAQVYPRMVPVLGMASCLVLLAFALPASPEAWIAGLVGLALGTGYYASKRRSSVQ